MGGRRLGPKSLVLAQIAFWLAKSLSAIFAGLLSEKNALHYKLFKHPWDNPTKLTLNRGLGTICIYLLQLEYLFLYFIKVFGLDPRKNIAYSCFWPVSFLSLSSSKLVANSIVGHSQDVTSRSEWGSLMEAYISSVNCQHSNVYYLLSMVWNYSSVDGIGILIKYWVATVLKLELGYKSLP